MSAKYLGVDILLTADGSPRVIEINDRPVGIARLEPRSETIEAIRGLAAGFQSVEIFLPLGYEIEQGTTSDPLVASNVASLSDSRVRLLLEDIGLISESLQGICEVTVTDIRHIANRLETVPERALVWDRSGRVPDLQRGLQNVNARAVREICVDKLKTELVLAEAGVPHVESIDGFVPGGHEYLITKPVAGSSSEGVLRVKASNFVADPAMMVQPWLEPSQIEISGRHYHYDLRVYVAAGVALPPLIRIASVPAERSPDSKGAWLTTTGPVRTASKFLPVSLVESCQALALRAASAIDAASRTRPGAAHSEVTDSTTRWPNPIVLATTT
ncbi:hypothetical protein GCM10010413_07180 [Promicromonospora sukumoe]|uniref:ATP-grasp domain-containing protein n=1 Tax=Promicromonospora sukumoe TaxID=88382 RepID=A0A7W3J571_9MICO|nr:hypothetical protein [Promicromonospora sukumoe]MBA8806389.1 hypothetical protein [Promicromonospora sukumoe]